MRTRILLLAALTIVAAVLAAGCGGSSNEATPPPPAEEPAPPSDEPAPPGEEPAPPPAESEAPSGAVEEGGLLRIGTTGDIDSINPFVAFNTESYQAFVIEYPLLVEYDEDLQFTGDWAESWDVSDDGLVLICGKRATPSRSPRRTPCGPQRRC